MVTNVFNSHLRLIAFYLPQYHPIPENNEWWGEGFTEWTNTAKATPLFSGHYQPHVPADLGFYDLRVPETRMAQAEMARQYGIEGFCYYHYWFAGKQLLERPFNEVLQSGAPDFPFCLCWANETWTGVWHGSPKRILIEQTYPGTDDHVEHFQYLLQAFQDKRYLTVEGKPILLIYKPTQIPEVRIMTELWRKKAIQAGLNGLHLVAVQSPIEWVPQESGFDARLNLKMPALRREAWVSKRQILTWIKNAYQNLRRRPTVYSYEDILPHLLGEPVDGIASYPCVVPNWDNTPRSKSNGLVFHQSTPQLFRRHLRKAIDLVGDLPPEQRIIMVKSWNEWAEGNHLEPDQKFAREYLQVIKDEMTGRLRHREGQ